MDVSLPGPSEDGSVCIAGGREGQSFSVVDVRCMGESSVINPRLLVGDVKRLVSEMLWREVRKYSQWLVCKTFWRI